MKHVITVIDNKFLCQVENGIVKVYPFKKTQPLNDYLNDGAKKLIETELNKLTGENYEINNIK